MNTIESKMRDTGWSLAIPLGIAALAAVWTIVVVEEFFLDKLDAAQPVRGVQGFNWKTNSCPSKENAADSLQECGHIVDKSFNGFKIKEQILAGLESGNSQFSNFVIDSVIAHYSQWSNSRFSKGTIREAVFPKAKFRGVVFDGVDFRGVRFQQAEFEDCVFRNAVIQDTTFRDATFIRTKFAGLKCRVCDFGGAKFIDSTAEGDFEGSFYNTESKLPFSFAEAASRGFSYR